MIVTVLGSGTSGGVPMIGCNCVVCTSEDAKDKRLRASVLLELNNQKIVIDAGPDFRQQMLQHRVKWLNAILLTHTHRDHTAGLDDIRAYNFFQKRPMDIYLTEEAERSIRFEYHYVFADQWYPGLPQMHFLNIENRPFFIGEIKFIPVLVKHHKMDVFGFRINDFTYITDANFIAPEEKEKIKGSNVLMLNALRKEKHISHFTLGEALKLINELQPATAYLTHISHQLGRHINIENELPQNVHLAYDGLKIEI